MIRERQELPSLGLHCNKKAAPLVEGGASVTIKPTSLNPMLLYHIRGRDTPKDTPARWSRRLLRSNPYLLHVAVRLLVNPIPLDGEDGEGAPEILLGDLAHRVVLEDGVGVIEFVGAPYEPPGFGVLLGGKRGYLVLAALARGVGL